MSDADDVHLIGPTPTKLQDVIKSNSICAAYNYLRRMAWDPNNLSIEQVIELKLRYQ